MSIDDVEHTLRRWASECSQVIGRHMDVCQQLLEKSHLDPGFVFVLRQFMVSCHVTSESALLLIGYARLWDVEMLIRSVVEGTLRFTYLCNIEERERAEKISEFWESIPEYEDIRTHNRLSHILSQVDNPNADEWKPFRDLLLSDKDYQELRQKFPQGKKMEQNWSFATLVNKTKISEIPDLDFRMLQFNYGISSHLLHKDAVALKIIWDRLFRDKARRDAVELAHAARMISDVHSLSAVRLLLFYKIQKTDTATARELAQADHQFLNEMRTAVQAWHQIEYNQP